MLAGFGGAVATVALVVVLTRETTVVVLVVVLTGATTVVVWVV